MFRRESLQLPSLLQKRDLYVVSVIGEDQVGIVSEVTQLLFREGFNIVDVEQTVIHSQFSMVLLLEPVRRGFKPSRLRSGLSRLAKRRGVNITVTPLREYKGLRLAGMKTPYVLTLLGPDRPGVVAAFSTILAQHRCNIERIKMVARGEFFAMEMGIDLRDASFSSLRTDLMAVARRMDMDVVAQPEQTFKKRKKVIVFDMDSTIVEGEVIDRLAKLAGAGRKVAAITERAMKGEMDYAASLKARVSFLKGLSLRSLESLAKTLKLTKGSEELIAGLKEMGFKIALISGGFSYFTDILKERLGFDYAFGNKLEVRKGRLTGRVRGKIIDAGEKARIMESICRGEGITRDEVVAVGDGSTTGSWWRTRGWGSRSTPRRY